MDEITINITEVVEEVAVAIVEGGGGGGGADPWGDAGITVDGLDTDGVLTLTKSGVTYSFTGTRP